MTQCPHCGGSFHAAVAPGSAGAVEAWQPIETAPKDGTSVLLFGQWAGEIAGIEVGGPEAFVGHWSVRGDYREEGFLWSIEGTDAYAAWCKPTHWMPLPAAPLPATQGEKND